MTAITPSEVSLQLGIQPSTLRKYCLKLEEHGIKFERNADNSRRYSAMDVVTLRKMQTLIQNDGMTVDNAAYTVSNGQKEEAAATVDNAATHNGIERHNDDVTAAVISEIRALKAEIIEQREIIDGFRIAQDKRDAYFVELLEGLQEEIHKLNEQPALPEPQAEVQPEPLPEPEKKGFFRRLFK